MCSWYTFHSKVRLSQTLQNLRQPRPLRSTSDPTPSRVCTGLRVLRAINLVLDLMCALWRCRRRNGHANTCETPAATSNPASPVVRAHLFRAEGSSTPQLVAPLLLDTGFVSRRQASSASLAAFPTPPTTKSTPPWTRSSSSSPRGGICSIACNCSQTPTSPPAAYRIVHHDAAAQRRLSHLRLGEPLRRVPAREYPLVPPDRASALSLLIAQPARCVVLNTRHAPSMFVHDEDPEDSRTGDPPWSRHRHEVVRVVTTSERARSCSSSSRTLSASSTHEAHKGYPR